MQSATCKSCPTTTDGQKMSSRVSERPSGGRMCFAHPLCRRIRNLTRYIVHVSKRQVMELRLTFALYSSWKRRFHLLIDQQSPPERELRSIGLQQCCSSRWLLRNLIDLFRLKVAKMFASLSRTSNARVFHKLGIIDLIFL